MTDQPVRQDAVNLTTGPLQPDRPVAVTPHFLASMAAIQIMADGGNAVEGAIAANAVLGVVLPDTCGIGGDLFALIHTPGDTSPLALNASGRCGSGWSAQALRDQGLTELPRRHLASITVPGCVDGWMALLARFGTLPLGDILEPASQLAHDGFSTSVELAQSLEALQPVIGQQASSPPLYPGGSPPPIGASLRRPELASTLQAIAQKGREGFYGERVGTAIVAAAKGGIAQSDLEVDQANWVEALGTELFGRTGWTIPPNSQGYLTLAAAWIFEQLSPPRDTRSPEYHHAMVESYRSVAWERDELVSDPDTAPLEPGQLLSPKRLRERVGLQSQERLATWPAPSRAPGGTAYLCVRDTAGMGVSFIQSNYHGIGSAISAGNTGIFLHNRGAGFSLEAGHPNELSPGRRPLHTLSPTLWTKDDKLSMLLGTRGGQYQPQTLLQMAVHRLWAGLTADESQQEARWLLDGWRTGAQPVLRFERRADPATLDGLSARGHRIELAGPWKPDWGPVSIIEVGEKSVSGSADPRVSTTAAISA